MHTQWNWIKKPNGETQNSRQETPERLCIGRNDSEMM